MTGRSSGHSSQGNTSRSHSSRGSNPPTREERAMQTSPYVRAVPRILAEMEQEREPDDNIPIDLPPIQENEEGKEEPGKMYVYRTDTGGWLISPTKVQAGEQETDEADPAQPVIVDSQELEADSRPTTKRDPPYFLHVLLILFLFIGLDNLDTVFAQFAPTVAVTITPVV